jgi:hypothetical protein
MKTQITDFQPQKGTKKHEKLRGKIFVYFCASLFSRLPSASVSLTPAGLCHLRAFALRVAIKYAWIEHHPI